MKKYFVHFRRNAFMSVSPELIKHEQQRMADLMRENILLDVKMSKGMDNLWMEFQISSREELVEIIKSLPMCKNLFFDVYEMV